MKSILYIQYTDPSAYPPLEHSSILLAERGWRVCHLGVVAGGAAKDLTLVRHDSISASLMSPPQRRGLTPLHYVRFLAWCRSEILRRRPSVVYCSDVRSYPVGLWASRLPGVVTVLHEHDPPRPGAGGIVGRLLWKARELFASRASLVVIPQDERARRFQEETDADRGKMHVVYNCPLKREIEEQASERKASGSGVTLWYHGALGEGQLPSAVIDALALAPDDVRLEFAGYETVSGKGHVEKLIERAQALGLADRVRYYGALPLRADLLRAAARADIGLALFANRFRDPMVGASNKPFDYLACGLPLLTNRTPEWEGFFGAAGVSISCDPENPDDIARAALALRNDPARRRAMADTGRRLVETKWNYEAQFARVLRIINGADVRLVAGECAAACKL
ncbi:MAG: hypothetical protein C3F11_00080 [Methylocystaceae bacterium]|nr:MAG: hypothetical protein C3F11_00080 [Methylocystaceae bacterium]